MELPGKRLIQDIVNERGLARARHACHAYEPAQRNGHVDIFQVMRFGALDDNGAGFHIFTAMEGVADTKVTSQILASERIRRLEKACHLAGIDHFPAIRPAPGPRSTTQSALRMVSSSCFNDNKCIAQVAQGVQAR